MKKRMTVILSSALVLLLTLTAACGSSDNKSGGANPNASTSTITGTVTATDMTAKTFQVKAKDGKDYGFKMVSDSKGDMNEINEHKNSKKEIEVRYRGAASPYEVVSAD